MIFVLARGEEYFTKQEIDLNLFTEDRSIYYDRYPSMSKLPLKNFMSSRGCPFKCSFCVNESLKSKIKRKSPEHFFNEIKTVVEKYKAQSLYFCDDLFVLDVKWLEEFTTLYKSLGIPYLCTGQAKTMTYRHAKALFESGCHTVSIGLETGNENIRRNVLNKNVTNKELLECSRILHDVGIKLQTSNMFCLPDDTIEDTLSTIQLNKQMGATQLFATIFLPFPKTSLAQYCIDKGYLPKDYSFEDMPNSYMKDSVLDFKDAKVIANIHKVAYLCVRFPKIETFLIFLAKRVRCKRLFLLFWMVGTVIRFEEERKLKFFQALKYLWSYRKGW